MEKLFYELLNDKQIKRCIKIIEILATTQEAVKLKNLQEQIDASRNTIINDIDQIRLMLPKNVEVVNIDNGILFQTTNNDSLDDLIISIIKDTIEYRLLDCVFANQLANIHEFAETLQFSESALRRKIKHINTVLKKYRCKLSHYKVEMLGNEADIRYFYYTYFTELQDLFALVNSSDATVCYNLLNSVMDKMINTNSLLSFGYRQATMWLLITIKRMRFQHIVKLDKLLVQTIKKRGTYRFFRNVYTIEIFNLLNIIPPENEIVFAYIVSLDSIVYSQESPKEKFFRSELDFAETTDAIDELLFPMICQLKIVQDIIPNFIDAHKAYLINISLLNRVSPLFQMATQSVKTYVMTNLKPIYELWYTQLSQNNPTFLNDYFFEDVCVKLAMISSQFVFLQDFLQTKILFSFSGEAGFVSLLETFIKGSLPLSIKAVFISTRQIDDTLLNQLQPDLIVCNYKDQIAVGDHEILRISHVPTNIDWISLRKHIDNLTFTTTI